MRREKKSHDISAGTILLVSMPNACLPLPDAQTSRVVPVLWNTMVPVRGTPWVESSTTVQRGGGEGGDQEWGHYAYKSPRGVFLRHGHDGQHSTFTCFAPNNMCKSHHDHIFVWTSNQYLGYHNSSSGSTLEVDLPRCFFFRQEMLSIHPSFPSMPTKTKKKKKEKQNKPASKSYHSPSTSTCVKCPSPPLP